MKTNKPVQQRFWDKVNKTDSCWEWTAGTNPAGYGRFRFNERVMMSHRVSYELIIGPIPDGLLLDHMCHNKVCVNPEHLRPVTSKQNGEHRIDLGSSSGFRGVHWHKRIQKWQASVRHNDKLHHVGYFTDLAEANSAVVAKRNDLYTHNDLDRRAA